MSVADSRCFLNSEAPGSVPCVRRCGPGPQALEFASAGWPAPPVLSHGLRVQPTLANLAHSVLHRPRAQLPPPPKGGKPDHSPDKLTGT